METTIVLLCEEAAAGGKPTAVVRKLAKLMKESGREAVLGVVMQCLEATLVQYKSSERDVARFFKFVVALGAVPQAELYYDGDASMAEEGAAPFPLLGEIVGHVLRYARCEDKAVRHGVAALFAMLVAEPPAGFELSDESYDAALESFVALVESDGVASVRVLAVAALKPLQDVGDEACRATATIAHAAVHDTSPLVRLEALKSLSSGVGIVISRVQDTNPKVRKEALKILGDVAPARLAPRERLMIVQVGRNDPSPDVRAAFSSMLCTEWVAKHHGNDLAAAVAMLSQGAADASEGADVANAALEHIFEVCAAKGRSALGKVARASLGAALPPVSALIARAAEGTLTQAAVFIWCARLEHLSAACDTARDDMRSGAADYTARDLDIIDEARNDLLPSEFILFTVTVCANPAHDLTCPPPHIL